MKQEDRLSDTRYSAKGTKGKIMGATGLGGLWA